MRKVALVHDWFCAMGGAERVLESFRSLYPDAPIYTSVCNYESLSPVLKTADIKTTSLQKKYNAKKDNHISLYPFMPMAFESFDLNEYEIVLSSSSCCAKGVITNPNTLHICFCHSPMRYAWEFYYEYTKSMKGLKKRAVKYLMNYMRMWDVSSSNRVDYFIANSENVAKRIQKHYRRESIVINPPVKTSFYEPCNADDEYFLCVSRLVPYKKIDLAVQVFNELGLPLVIIGDGPEYKKLQSIAKSNIRILGRQPDEVVKGYYAKCRAFIFPGEEDFGIAPVEAQASGRPVIAYGKGGALETVVDGETGLFFKEQTEESLKNAIAEFQKRAFIKDVCRQNAERFSVDRFEKEITTYIKARTDEISKRCKG